MYARKYICMYPSRISFLLIVLHNTAFYSNWKLRFRSCLKKWILLRCSEILKNLSSINLVSDHGTISKSLSGFLLKSGSGDSTSCAFFELHFGGCGAMKSHLYVETVWNSLGLSKCSRSKRKSFIGYDWKLSSLRAIIRTFDVIFRPASRLSCVTDFGVGMLAS